MILRRQISVLAVLLLTTNTYLVNSDTGVIQQYRLVCHESPRGGSSVVNTSSNIMCGAGHIVSSTLTCCLQAGHCSLIHGDNDDVNHTGDHSPSPGAGLLHYQTSEGPLHHDVPRRWWEMQQRRCRSSDSPPPPYRTHQVHHPSSCLHTEQVVPMLQHLSHI